MRGEPTTARAAARVGSELWKAIAEARAAYEFGPNSYTNSCLSACLAAKSALAVLRAALDDD
jgi:hypothetical protein